MEYQKCTGVVLFVLAVAAALAGVGTAESRGEFDDVLSRFKPEPVAVRSKRNIRASRAPLNIGSRAFVLTLLNRLTRSADEADAEMYRVSEPKEKKCKTCGISWKPMTLSKEGCHSKTVPVPQCKGMCETFQIPDVAPRHMTTNSSICRPKKVRVRRFTLKCRDGFDPSYYISYPKSCMCAKCLSDNMACRLLY